MRVPQAADVRDVGLPPLAHMLREVVQRISAWCGVTLCIDCLNEGCNFVLELECRDNVKFDLDCQSFDLIFDRLKGIFEIFERVKLAEFTLELIL